MINLWCPFRKGLQDVMCIFYLPSAVLHQLGTQALQNWFLMKCRVDLLTPPSWWGKIYPFVEGFFHPACSPGKSWPAWGMWKLSLKAQARHQGWDIRRWCPSPDAMDKLTPAPVSTMLGHFFSCTRYWTYKQKKNTTSTPQILFYHSSSVFSSLVQLKPLF